jgi:hypothetical protein
MADKKISALTASTTPLAGTEVLPIVQGGSTVKVSVANLTAGRAVSASSLTASTDNIIIGTTAKGVTTGSAIPLGLGVNNAVNAVTIDTSNRVGLGTPTPLATLDVNGGVSVGRTNAGQPIVLFNGDAVNAQQLDIRMSGTNAVLNATRAGGTPPDIIFQCDNSERMRLSTGGNLTITSNNLVIGTAGKGIDFSANTHAAGMTSELLNWYEEGAWTPSVGGNATYTIQEGYYVRVGDLVYVQCQLLLNVIGSGSTTTISGLPFQVLSPSSSSRGTGAVWYFGNLATNVTTLTAGATPAGTTITFGGLTAAAATMTVPVTVFGNGSRVDFSLVYRAN